MNEPLSEQEQTEREQFLKDYGTSKNGNFFIIDSLGVPHPYMITPKHLEFNGDSIYLDIERAEKNSQQAHPNNILKQAVCDICKSLHFKNSSYKILSYDEHQRVLLVNCKMAIQDNEELKTYLLKIKEKATKNKFIGFAFKQDF